MDKLFKLKENGTDVRTEVLAGLTTFFAMSYILFVNPQMLAQTGMPAQGVFLATIIESHTWCLSVWQVRIEGHHQGTSYCTNNRC